MKKIRAIIALLLGCIMCLYGTAAFALADDIESNTSTELEEVQLVPENCAAVTASYTALQQQIDTGVCPPLTDVFVTQTNARAVSASYWEFPDETIATPGSLKAYGIISLGPNEILQAGLVCPDNEKCDYDLYVADVVDGSVNSILTGSQYVTSKIRPFLDEGIDYVNTSSLTKDLALLVHASGNTAGEAYPYTLYFSIDDISNCNASERDQNIASPYMSIKPGQYASGFVLNSGADVDWYALNIDEVDQSIYYSRDVSITVTNPTTGEILPVTVQLYQASINTQNQFDFVTPIESGKYRFSSIPAEDTYQGGTYYIRIAPQVRSSFTPCQYKLSVHYSAYAAMPKSFSSLSMRTDYDTSGTNYVTWPAGYGYVVFTQGENGWLEVHGQVFDASGAPLSNTSMQCEVKFTNRYWDTHNGPDSLTWRKGSCQLNADGEYTVRLSNMPSPAGKSTYHSTAGLTHHYDLADIQVTVYTIQKSNGENTRIDLLSAVQTVYHESYYTI